MANKYSDSSPSDTPQVDSPDRRDAVFVVASDDAFFDAVSKECALPPVRAMLHTLPELSAELARLDRIRVGFVVLVEPRGRDIDPHELRRLRLDFPQLVIIAILESCDQRSQLRLQSIGVHGVLLPPFSEIDVEREIATVVPNVPQFKRHPDLMNRGQARLDFLIPSELPYVLGVNYLVSLLLKEFGFPLQDTRVNVPLACDEAITNAIIHGNGRDPEKKVNVQIYVSHSRFRIRVRDQGAGFDSAAVDDPRHGDNVMRSSGRGIFLMRNIMDLVEYKEGGRVLELEKRNPNASSGGNHGSRL